jgi:hypothetical protein
VAASLAPKLDIFSQKAVDVFEHHTLAVAGVHCSHIVRAHRDFVGIVLSVDYDAVFVNVHLFPSPDEDPKARKTRHHHACIHFKLDQHLERDGKLGAVLLCVFGV